MAEVVQKAVKEQEEMAEMVQREVKEQMKTVLDKVEMQFVAVFKSARSP